jgi:cytochrome c oxidase subunit III
MSLLSDRFGKTSEVVVLPASTEDSAKAAPGLVRMGLLLACGSMAVLFGSLVFAYYWRKAAPGVWDQVALPNVLWVSTAIILASSVVFELGRRAYGRGEHRTASTWLRAAGILGAAFLIGQLLSWRGLVENGAYLEQNPYSGFFYLFTGLHAAHLIGGLFGLGYVTMSPTRRRELVDAATFYWHFLGVLWLALFYVLAH